MQRRGTQAFPGGVHPTDGSDKALSMDQAVKPYRPDIVTILSEQTFGGTCQFTVTPGESVIEGQLIGKPEAFLAAPLHASISGTVLDVKEVEQLGRKITACIIQRESDHCQVSHTDTSIPHDTAAECAERKGVDYQTEISDIRSISREEILSGIRDGGLTGMGGAGFPTHKKYETDKPIDALLINGAECEPFLTCDYRLMLEEPERIVRGLQIMLKLHPNAKGVIGIEMNKPEAIASMQKACEGIDNITVQPLVTKFPQGSEKHLIYAITKREVKSGALPASAGCIVDNVDTVVAIERAICKGRPLMRRIVTVSGKGIKNPGNYKIRIGMTLRDLVDAIGGFNEENPPVKLIAGGPMMGPTLYTLDVASVKTTSGLLCFTKDEAYIPEERNCIRCGKCVEHCPMGLMPFMLNAFAIKGDGEGFVKHHGLDCIECGSCSYECPAKRQLAQSIRATKKIEAGKKAAAAAAARAKAEAEKKAAEEKK